MEEWTRWPEPKCSTRARRMSGSPGCCDHPSRRRRTADHPAATVQPAGGQQEKPAQALPNAGRRC
eukprot:4664753-Pyramimonas_sp.AAC.1